MSRLQAVRERLAGKYKASLRVEAEQLKAQLRAEPLDEANLRKRAHKLKGSGASFGFPDITAAAIRVEQAPSEAFTVAVEALLAVLIEHGNTI